MTRYDGEAVGASSKGHKYSAKDIKRVRFFFFFVHAVQGAGGASDDGGRKGGDLCGRSLPFDASSSCFSEMWSFAFRICALLSARYGVLWPFFFAPALASTSLL